MACHFHDVYSRIFFMGYSPITLERKKSEKHLGK
jgi:hypothetical protein